MQFKVLMSILILPAPDVEHDEETNLAIRTEYILDYPDYCHDHDPDPDPGSDPDLNPHSIPIFDVHHDPACS